MTYKELEEAVKTGKIGLLPNFKGYFKWNYAKNKMFFYNEDYIIPADKLDIQKRDDFYFII